MRSHPICTEPVPLAAQVADESVTDGQTSVFQVCPGKGSGRPWLRSGDSQMDFASPGARMPSSAADLSPVCCLWCLDICRTYAKLKGVCFFAD